MKDFMLNNFQTTVPNSIWKIDDDRTRTRTTYGNFNTNSSYMYIKHYVNTHVQQVYLCKDFSWVEGQRGH